jgi:hypothetical protein
MNAPSAAASMRYSGQWARMATTASRMRFGNAAQHLIYSSALETRAGIDPRLPGIFMGE